MSDAFARAALGAYRLFGAAAYPLIGPYVGWRASRGKEERARRRERYGYPGADRPGAGPLVWVHAASVGESTAVMPMVREIAAENIHIVMTTGTVTSAALVQDRLGSAVIHQYVPLDLKPSIMRFLDHWRPDLAIVAESEIWPMTVLELGRRRIPQVLVNARLSDRSFQRWKAAPSLAEALLENLSHVVAQSDIDGERYHLLGARAVTVAGNLKADTNPPPFEPIALQALKADLKGRPVWAAVSTHAGEEEIAAEVHRTLKVRHPGLVTIIVPRHVERADALEKSFIAKGLTVARRSAYEPVPPETDIFLGDTMGEMGLYLRLTEIAFVGRSLQGQGGQNPLEAAMLGTAILSGRYVQNFRDAYQRLLKNGGARLVKDEDGLSDMVGQLLGDPALRRRMIESAANTVGEMRGALQRTMQALEPFLHPMKLAIRLERSDRGAQGR
ncbi:MULTISPECIES: lipid IV(A) 3-deoxy-D-manno-octulosonic acid transferase [unclassified Aureimonas]|uniref:lipid IV(A) 3-deoxy-D-manno-octulosonic acid transferase n=1 Tax=unclassified Aureimonas TaxID=2615206 RepID=UPI0006F647FF|nr:MULTISPECIES: lipid IV(A) 3-deoxy-D-manno-octulosonic acid transferase [unclassified Aureimonas]KQT69730.1 3-deoxy-D-manno-octulosonic acid transferase [Aureimonas sp. Leaf427]KQT76118.1 3-deoxy-D-manno-octulosonic acid transferase [Aureimonas sp. Leaf460]